VFNTAITAYTYLAR